MQLVGDNSSKKEVNLQTLIEQSSAVLGLERGIEGDAERKAGEQTTTALQKFLTIKSLQCDCFIFRVIIDESDIKIIDYLSLVR